MPSLASLSATRHYWGKGYGSRRTRTLLQYAFEEAGLHRIELQVFAFNPRAIRVYEKVGFRLEGRASRALFVKAHGTMSTSWRSCARSEHLKPQ